MMPKYYIQWPMLMIAQKINIENEIVLKFYPVELNDVVSASKYIVLAIPVPDGFIFNGSLTGGVM